MEPTDFASPLRAAQTLVPDYAQQQAQRQMMAIQQLQAQGAQMQMQQQQREWNLEDQYQADLNGVLANPHDPNAIRQLLIKYPKQATALKAGMDSLDATTRRNELTQLAGIYSAAAAGKHDLAASELEKRITADKAAGQDTALDDEVLGMLRSDDPAEKNRALNVLSFILAGATGEEHFGTVAGQLSKSRQPDYREVGPGVDLINPNEIDPNTGQPKVVYSSPFKEQVVMVDGRPYAYTPGTGGATTGGAGGGTGQPRGIRNNNPGNLRFGQFAQSMGATGQDADGFAIFGDPQAGVRAQTELLKGKGYIGGGRNTIAGIISKYAPSSDGNDVRSYVQFVAKRTGIAPNQPVTPAQADTIAEAIRAFENGGASASNSTKSPPPPPGFVLDK